MVKRITITTLLSCGILGMTFAPGLQADESNKWTVITASEPLQVPGRLLAPGTYVLKLIDSPSNRHIVQIYNEDETQLQTTILALPNYRLQPTGDTKFTFWEVPVGEPAALRSWFYPGDNFGQEFAYPKESAKKMAKQMKTPVLATMEEGADVDLMTVKVMTVNETGRMTEPDRATYSRPGQQ